MSMTLSVRNAPYYSTLCPQCYLFRTDESFFFKFGELIPESTQDRTAVTFPTKLV